MTITRYYKYVFSDNSIRFFTPEEAERYLDENEDKVIIHDGYYQELKDPKMVRDGFKPGWQHNLGMEVGSYSEYKRICKQKGYEIAGNDRPTIRKEKKSKYLDDSTLKDLYQKGAKLSGNEAEALKKGEKLHK